MDVHLKLLAEASLHVGAAEEAVAERGFLSARDQLDCAALLLADLREAWPSMTGAERTVVGPAAVEVRARLDYCAGQIPTIRALSETAPVIDPEQELEPEAA